MVIQEPTPTSNLIPFGFDLYLHDGPVGNGNLLPAVWNDLRMTFNSRENWPTFMPYDHRGGGLYCITHYHKKSAGFPISQLTDQKFVYSIPMTGCIQAYLGLDNLQDRKNDSIFEGVSPVALDAIRKNRALLAFDCIFEGHCNTYWKIFDHIFQQCAAYDVPFHNVLYATGNVSTHDNYAAWEHPDKSMRILTTNWFLDGMRSALRHVPMQFVSENEALKKRPKHFLNFNRQPRPHRVFCVSQLIRRKLLNNFLVSFPPYDLYKFYGVDYLRHHINVPTVMNDVLRMKSILPLEIDTDDFLMNHAFTHNKTPYLDSYINLVSETRFYDTRGDSVFFSEKIFKPIANLQPFIIIGPAGSLAKLRQMGYITFDPFINESYDSEPDPYHRIEMILDEVERLCRLPLQTIHNWYGGIFPLLVHNKHVMLEGEECTNDIVKALQEFF